MASEVGAELVGWEDNGSGHGCQINSVVIPRERRDTTFVISEKGDRIYFTYMRVLILGGRCGERPTGTTYCERHQGFGQEEELVLGLHSPRVRRSDPLLKMTRCSSRFGERREITDG